VGWETGERERERERERKKRTVTYITSGRWVILWPKSSWKQREICFQVCTTQKAAFGCDFRWQQWCITCACFFLGLRPCKLYIFFHIYIYIPCCSPQKKRWQRWWSWPKIVAGADSHEERKRRKAFSCYIYVEISNKTYMKV
jgi:hypothetical protein